MRMRRYAPILILALAGCGPCGYNRIVTEEQQVEAAWSQVENQLQRRADLIPNLVETVKGYARHEKGVFDDIANARAAMMGASSRAEKIQAANQFEGAISKLLSISEAYPQLKADTTYQRLMDELAPRTAWRWNASATTRRSSSTTRTSAASRAHGGRRSAASRQRSTSRRRVGRAPFPRCRSSRGWRCAPVES